MPYRLLIQRKNIKQHYRFYISLKKQKSYSANLFDPFSNDLLKCFAILDVSVDVWNLPLPPSHSLLPLYLLEVECFADIDVGVDFWNLLHQLLQAEHTYKIKY